MEGYEVGDLVSGVDGSVFVRPPENCANRHALHANCIVGTSPCRCGDRHISWCCNECGHVTYGPALGDACELLHGAARVR